jgi:hypothetical protein
VSLCDPLNVNVVLDQQTMPRFVCLWARHPKSSAYSESCDNNHVMVAVHGKKPEVRLHVHNVTVLILSNENFM